MSQRSMRSFRDDPRTVRYGAIEILYGHDEIKAFRAARSPVGLMRTLSRTVIHTATAATLRSPPRCSTAPRCPARSAVRPRPGCRFEDGWHIVTGHVSVIDEPPSGSPHELRDCTRRPPHARGGASAAAGRRDRARRAGARRHPRRDGAGAALRRVAHAGARGDPPARRERPDRDARRTAARWWRGRARSGSPACSRRWPSSRRCAPGLPPSA